MSHLIGETPFVSAVPAVSKFQYSLSSLVVPDCLEGSFLIFAVSTKNQWLQIIRFFFSLIWTNKKYKMENINAKHAITHCLDIWAFICPLHLLAWDNSVFETNPKTQPYVLSPALILLVIDKVGFKCNLRTCKKEEGLPPNVQWGSVIDRQVRTFTAHPCCCLANQWSAERATALLHPLKNWAKATAEHIDWEILTTLCMKEGLLRKSLNSR